MKIYTDGSGNGQIAWYNEDTGESDIDNIIFDVSSNEAEYWAVLIALRRVVKGLSRSSPTYKNVKEIEIWSDSMLVVRQLSREWKIKSEKMRDMVERIQDTISLLETFGVDVTFQWIRRKENIAGKMLG